MIADWNWIGAKWWKFDFHTHTPASDDYGKGSNQSQLKLIEPKEWLLYFMRTGIDCVAVTDHNSGTWIDFLKQANDALRAENHPDYRPLFLFPGVEINVNGGIHILALLSCNKCTADIDTLLGAVKFRGQKGACETCTESSIIEVLDEIQKSCGLIIPAHVDENNGLFVVCSGTTLKQVLDRKDILAIEVKDSSKSKPQVYIDKKLNWTELLGTDSHHPSGIPGHYYPGSHFTWVKMSKPTFEGLKLALIDGNLSLKRSDLFADNPNIHSPIAIESIVVDQAKYLGRGELFKSQFNPWLNTIIGGRGTGKSTVLEFIRIVLQRKNELPRSLEDEFVKYRQISVSRHDEGLLTDNAVITLFYRKDDTRFRIRWTASNDQYEIQEETQPNIWSPTLGDIMQRFPVRIYSQKQIFELAKDPDALLRIIDDATEINYREWKRIWDEYVSKYLSIRAQEREVAAGLQEEISLKGELADVKRKLEVFEKTSHADILKSYQLRQNQNKAIENWERSWATITEQIKSFGQSLIPNDIDRDHFNTERTEDQEFLNEVANIQLSFKSMQAEIIVIAQKVESIYHEWLKKKASLSIIKDIEQISRKYAELLGLLSEVGAGDPNEYSQLVKNHQDIEEKLKEIDKKREMLVRLRENSDACLKELQKHRKQITELRHNFLQSTLAGNPYVQINVVPFGNTQSVEEEFRKIIDRSSGGFDRDIGLPGGEEGLLSLLKTGSDTTIEQQIENIKRIVLSIHNGDENSIKDHRFASYIQNINPEQLDRLQFWFPEDSLEVQYSVSGGGFQPVRQGSPGQKTAALLAFLLSYGKEPLVLDQPEDDLDNNLICDLIVTQLREIKQRRQVIVVTHNANIVVNGDAENIIALDVISGQTRITTQGGLQEMPVRDTICRVMEGGKEAFEQRYKRINAVAY